MKKPEPEARTIQRGTAPFTGVRSGLDWLGWHRRRDWPKGDSAHLFLADAVFQAAGIVCESFTQRPEELMAVFTWIADAGRDQRFSTYGRPLQGGLFCKLDPGVWHIEPEWTNFATCSRRLHLGGMYPRQAYLFLDRVQFEGALTRLRSGGDAAPDAEADHTDEVDLRIANDAEVEQFGRDAVKAEYGVGAATEALKTLWPRNLHPLPREQARSAIAKAKSEAGLPTGAGRPRAQK